MPQVYGATHLQRKNRVLNAARSVQFSPVSSPDGSISDRDWAVYVRSVMEQILARYGTVPTAEIVMHDLQHLIYLELLVLEYDEERWVWL